MPSAPAPSPEFFALQPVVAGRYSLDRELGRGGMGVVFLAHDVALDRPVAIKLLPPALARSEALRARFLREARAAARLSHPHIVPVHAVEEHEALAFFVMAFVDGETLGERVRRAGPLSAAEATRVMQEVAWALAHAHAHGIAHRDVKPDNVMLERATGRAVVTDFGIARHGDGGDTPAGAAMGTPHYMSPEQACGDPGDARSDLYSLGATIYFAATGRPPFEGPTAVALLAQHATAAPVPVAQARPGLPSRLAALVDRCLAKEPDARPASAEALAESLRATQGPDLPPPLRAFLREAEGGLLDAGTAFTASGISLALWPMHDGSVFASIFATLVFLSTAGITASLGLARLVQLAGAARTLVRAGYGHDAVRTALATREREGAEEAADARSERGWRSPRTWGRLAAGATASAAAVWLSLVGDGGLELVGAFGSIVLPTVTLRALWDDVRRGPPLWTRVLRGRVGRTLLGLSGRGLPRPAPAVLEGQPTAVLLERAAEDLYEALPAGERAALGDVPAVVRRLRAEAEDEARRPTAVAALETLRLDLMRLHAGLARPGDLTQQLERVRRLGEHVDARLELEDG